MSSIAFAALLRRPGRQASERVRMGCERLHAKFGPTPLFKSPTITVLGPASLPHVRLPGGDGIVLGHLFDRSTNKAVLPPGDARLAAPVDDFVSTYWGGYLALRTRYSAAEILRDPSGAVACYHVELDDWHIVTSAPLLLIEGGFVDTEIDWTILTQALVYRDLRPARTALRGIAEIQPGVVARVFPTGLQTECAWSPWAFTGADREIIDPVAAIASVRSTVKECVTAWGSRFRKPLVEISGGLDSAIVAAAQAGASPSVSAISFRPVPGDPDETPYARAIADHLGIDLTVLAPDLLGVDPLSSAAADLARPNARSFAQALDGPELDLALAIGADAFFSGGGGDNVFCYLRSVAPIIDRIKRQGIGRGVFETASDMAMLADTNPWAVLVRTARRMLRRTLPAPWVTNCTFLTSSALDGLPFPEGHPWLPVPSGTLPGKRAQVMSLIRVQNHLDAHGRQELAPIVFPLLSQPVMEVCLTIPSWMWCAGGSNRSVARKAFADALPAAVIARQSKGAFDSLCTQILVAHRDSLRAMLMEGALAAAGLLDLCEIARHLDAPVPDGTAALRLLMLADVEAWTQSWQARLSQAVPGRLPG